MFEFSELFLLLLAAMTCVNAMDKRQVFEALRAYLVRKGFSYRSLFWLTGFLAFFFIAHPRQPDHCTDDVCVLLAMGKNNAKFVCIGCINVVVAANAGGAFSPVGDITTLMVWQKGLVAFAGFFQLFVPSLVNHLVPAAIMYFAIPDANPVSGDERVAMRRGAKRILFLFGCTIATAVSFHSFLHIPPFPGMKTGLAYLQFFGYYLKKTHRPDVAEGKYVGLIGDVTPAGKQDKMFDFFNRLARAEWDTLLSFYCHLKWTPVILPGYAASILVQMWLNASSFPGPIGAG